MRDTPLLAAGRFISEKKTISIIDMQKKIFLWFVLIVVLPSGIIYFVMNHFLIRYVINQQIETNNQLIREMRKNLDTKLLHYQQLTMQFYLNDEAQAEIERLKLELAESRLRIRLLEEMSKKRNTAKGHNRHNASSDC